MNIFEFRQKNQTTALVCRPLEAMGFVNGFSTRLGGVSPLPEAALNLGFFAGDSRENVTENRHRFLNTLGVPHYPLHTLRQTHSRLSHRAETMEAPDTPPREGDALYSNQSGLVVGVLTADCQPVLLVDTRTRAFAAIHAGWRGTLQRIVEHTFEKLRETYGTRPEDCAAALGPSASVEKYEVGDELVEQFHAEFAYASDLFARPSGSRKQHLNVREANVRQLLEMKLPAERIFVSDACTMKQTDLFFSYRCEQATGAVGRLLSVVGRKD
ncbi:MAG: peptidoglycan editing factor PgeF [Blastocatellia bacterium]|nr:peptidoglycan editing factor PgeF [Blastocatellia bacterium]